MQTALIYIMYILEEVKITFHVYKFNCWYKTTELCFGSCCPAAPPAGQSRTLQGSAAEIGRLYFHILISSSPLVLVLSSPSLSAFLSILLLHSGLFMWFNQCY